MTTSNKPSFIFSRQSANIATYGERGRDERELGYLWVSVLHQGWLPGRRVDGIRQMRKKRIPSYRIDLYAFGEGAVGSFNYHPKTKPRTERLSNQTITRLVREYLRENPV